MTATLVCWKCGTPIKDLPLPLARLAACPHCRVDLHVCKLCKFYDISVAKYCQEPIADEVLDKERSNFCGYFYAKPNAYQPQDTAKHTKALDALFGKETQLDKPAETAREQLENLFSKREV